MPRQEIYIIPSFPQYPFGITQKNINKLHSEAVDYIKNFAKRNNKNFVWVNKQIADVEGRIGKPKELNLFQRLFT